MSADREYRMPWRERRKWRRRNKLIAEAEAHWDELHKPFSFREVNPKLAKKAFVFGYTSAKGWDRI